MSAIDYRPHPLLLLECRSAPKRERNLDPATLIGSRPPCRCSTISSFEHFAVPQQGNFGSRLLQDHEVVTVIDTKGCTPQRQLFPKRVATALLSPVGKSMEIRQCNGHLQSVVANWASVPKGLAHAKLACASIRCALQPKTRFAKRLR